MNRTVRQRLALAAAVVLCIALAALPLFPALQGLMPVEAAPALSLPPWQDAAPGDSELNAPSAETLRYLPWNLHLARTVRSGQLPLWNPLASNGLPFFGLWETRCLSPFSIPLYLLPFPAATTASAALKIAAAIVFAFIAARRFGMSRSASAVAAAVFGYSPLLLNRLGYPISDGLPWLPLILLQAEYIIFGRRRAWIPLAFFMALAGFGGGPVFSAALVLFVLLYVFLRSALFAGNPETGGQSLRAALAAVAGGALLLAVQLAPYAEFLWHSASSRPPGSASGASISSLTALLAPSLWTDASPTPLLYAGSAALMMLPLWLSVRSAIDASRRGRFDLLLIMAAGFTVAGAATAPAAASWPFVHELTSSAFFMLNALALGLMAGEALDEWMSLNAEECQKTLRRLAIYAPLFLIVCAAVAAWAAASGAATAVEVFGSLWFPAFAFLAVFALIGITMFKPSARAFGGVLVLLIITDMLLATQPAMPWTSPQLVYPRTAFIERLEDVDQRLGGRSALQAWPLLANGLPQTYSSSGVELKRHAAFMEAAEADPALMRLMGAGALLFTRQDIQGPFAPLRPSLKVQHVFQSGAVLFEDLHATQRAYLAKSGGAAQGPDMEAAEAPILPFKIAAPDDAAAAEGRVEVVRAEANTVELDVEPDGTAMLVLTDAYYPGWQAEAEGQRTTILPANGMSRSIILPAGAQRVVFTYRPLSVLGGAGLSTAALLTLAFAAFILRRASSAS